MANYMLPGLAVFKHTNRMTWITMSYRGDISEHVDVEKQDHHWREVSGQLLRWARCWNCLDLQIVAQHHISSHIGPSQLLLAWRMKHLQGWLPEDEDFWNSFVCLAPCLLSLASFLLWLFLVLRLKVLSCGVIRLRTSWPSHRNNEQ